VSYYSSVPFVIPSENIFIQSYSTGPSASGLNCSMTIPLINAKEIIVLFPRSANDLTVFRNPEYHHLQLTLLNRNFPMNGADTTSTDFYTLERESCNLDTILPPTESFEDSYKNKVCSEFPYRQRSIADDTDFLLIFNLQRQSANAFFADPVNSSNETISVNGSPKKQELGDVYYILNAENDALELKYNHAKPILIIVSDTFWMFSSKSRCQYVTDMSWNECLNKYYPDIYQRLAQAA
jgi:hypothetical protein